MYRKLQQGSFHNNTTKYSYLERLKKFGLTSLKDRRVRGDMIEVYKLISGKEQIESGQFFTLADNRYGLRGHELKIAKERARLDTRKFFFSQRVVNGWNRLPAHVVKVDTVNGFKNAYGHQYLDKISSRIFVTLRYRDEDPIVKRPGAVIIENYASVTIISIQRKTYTY